MPVPLDEYPIHQTPLSLRYVGSTDRNFYDRNYFNAHDRTGDVFLISGFGIYPHLGVKDAYVAVRRGDTQHVVRFSDALDLTTKDERMSPAVGGYRLEIIEPLHKVRLICDGDPSQVACDITWEGSFPAIDEERQLLRQGTRPILDTWRFAQVGSWSGELHVGGERIEVSPDTWLGTRDRSWGIRPIGEAEPAGRPADDPNQFGFWWLYVPLRFDGYAIVLIAQEDGSGHRTLNDAVRVFADGRIDQLGWPRVKITYASGSRIPQRAVISLTEPDGTPLTLEVESLGFMPLHIGCGYGGDPEWVHGAWKGKGWSDYSSYDMSDPQIIARFPWGVIDHVGRGTIGDQVGWGLFEHGTIGRHTPSGFADLGSVAP